MPYVLRTRTKKFIGIFFILGLVLIYSVVAVTLAGMMSTAHWSVHLLFFAVSGIGWIVPAMGIIKWMVTDSGRG